MLALVGGLLVGGVVNMMLVTAGAALIPAPAGVNVMDPDSIAASIHLFEPVHFLFPFIAHAAGAFTGALVAALVAPSGKMVWAMVVAGITMLGGIANTFMLPAPAWFIATDLLLAYLPPGWLAGKLATRGSAGANPATSDSRAGGTQQGQQEG